MDPENAEALGGVLRELTQNGDLRQDLIRRGVARARLFSWEKAVRETWDVYREVLD